MTGQTETKCTFRTHDGTKYQYDEIRFSCSNGTRFKTLYKANGYISNVHPLLVTECKYCGAPYPMFKCRYCGKVQQ